MKKHISAALMILIMSALSSPAYSSGYASPPKAMTAAEEKEAYRENLEKQKKDPFNRKLLGEQYRLETARGEYENAERTLNRLCSIEKNNLNLRINRVALLRIMGKAEEAREEGKKLMLLCPSSPELYSNTALSCSDTGNHDEALKFIETAESLSPSDIRLKLNKAKILSAAGKTQESARLLNLLLEDAPTYGRAVNNEGAVKYKSGESEGGEISFEEALKTEDPGKYPGINEAISLLNRGKYDSAIRKLSELENSHPCEIILKKALAQALLYAGRYSEAEKKAAEGIAMSDNDAELWNIDGAAIFMQEKYDAAEAAFRRALWIDPDYAAANSNIALCYKKNTMFKKAEIFLQEAIKKDPYNPDLRYNLATVLEAKGRNAEAAEAFRKYLELSPDTTDKPEVRERIRQLEK